MLDQLMNAIPTSQLARAVGEDEATTRKAVQAALPALLGGLSANANDQTGARSLLDALGQHQNSLADDVRLDAVDPADGEKILGHVFGGNTDAVVNQLGGLGGGGQMGGLVRKLLPLLAPIVLSWLAKQVGGAMGGQGAPRGGAPTTSQPDGPLGQGRPDPAAGSAAQDGGIDPTSVLQDVLGGALGGVTGRQSGSGGGGILGDVLGSILGGGRR
ncbi:DUF937 domain-containing protein [Ornithinimicrobium avium]|uniref:DUF937 domain-containing protein n=2 Tax=Ornithinimicrobium avium TaxID=2283195 RepID=A0A345NSD7_9MICO|nr:DUF937 domain-containing protein [Ornithinimicrobium avium]